MNSKPVDQAEGRRFLFVIDEGWRCEKSDLLAHLKGHVDFGVATHDDLAYEALKDQFNVTKLPVRPLKRGIVYGLTMFFARELPTNLVRYRKRIKHDSLSASMRLVHGLRNVVKRLGFSFYSYSRALAFLYRASEAYSDILAKYDALVFLPVEIQDKRIIYEAQRAGLQTICWVYSWDNPMKDNEFMTDADRYLVWNEANAQDLLTLHGIPRTKIDIVGPVQFDYLIEKRDHDAKPSFPESEKGYVLYACALGLDAHLSQEVAIVRRIRELMDGIDPEVRLLVRPYPFRKNKVYDYAELRALPGVELTEVGNLQQNAIVMSREDMDNKCQQIAAARCFINLGSTIGLEASFTRTPILQLGFNVPFNGPAHLDITEALKNEHLRYMIDDSFPNTVRSEEALEQALRDILSGHVEPYMAYSKKLAEFADPLRAPCYKEVFLQKLRAV